MSEKLIRDKIPVKHRIADEFEVKDLLLKKLQEEVSELMADQNEEELADILEVIDAIITKFGFNKNEIIAIKDEKKLERGGFENNIVGIFEDKLADKLKH